MIGTDLGDWLFSDAHMPFLVSAIARELANAKDEASILNACHQVALYPDGFNRDGACFMVSQNGERIWLTEWAHRNHSELIKAGRLWPRALRIERDSVEPFGFTMSEFVERALPIYRGTLHAWPDHATVKQNFSKWPKNEQIDFIRTYLDYFESNALPGDEPVVEWVRSNRKYRYLFVVDFLLEEMPALEKTRAKSIASLSEEMRSAGKQLFDLCWPQIATGEPMPPEYPAKMALAEHPEEAKYVWIRRHIDYDAVERIFPRSLVEEIVELHKTSELFGRKPSIRTSDSSIGSSRKLTLRDIWSALRESSLREIEIEFADMSLRLYDVWRTYAQGNSRYEAGASPEIEPAMNRLRSSAQAYLSSAW